MPLNVLMVHPNQASSLQGSHCGNDDILAVNVSDTGSGWRQSTQNGTLLVPRGGIVNQNRMWLPLPSVTCTTPPFFLPQSNPCIYTHTNIHVYIYIYIYIYVCASYGSRLLPEDPQFSMASRNQPTNQPTTDQPRYQPTKQVFQ